MSSFRVLAPCTVRQPGNTSAVHYRKVGELVTVADKTDADLLVKGGFLEPVSDVKAASPPPAAEKPKP